MEAAWTRKHHELKLLYKKVSPEKVLLIRDCLLRAGTQGITLQRLRDIVERLSLNTSEIDILADFTVFVETSNRFFHVRFV